MEILLKISNWLRANLAGILGVTQAFLKMLKEVVTLVVDFLSLLIPAAQAQETVVNLRNAINKIDAVVETIKAKLLNFLQE